MKDKKLTPDQLKLKTFKSIIRKLEKLKPAQRRMVAGAVWELYK